MWSRLSIVPLLITLLCTACAPSTPQPSSAPSSAPGEQPRPAASRPTQTLVAVVRIEPTSLATRSLTFAGAQIAFTVRAFNAELDMMDAQDHARPYLAEALPQLNTDTWRVLPDGRMETTYHLKPNLTWHDGTSLTADDFAFALKVFKTPELGVSAARPISLIDEIVAPDPRTVVFHWKVLYPEAGVLSSIGSLGNGGFQPLPRHILQHSFEQDPPDTFANNPYWAMQYVGLGPYKLEKWEPGSYIEGSAFDGHVLGRPKIDRIQIKFMADENTVLANLLSENVHLATDRSIRFEHTQVMKREWDSNHKGIVLPALSLVRYLLMQNRPEFVNPKAMTDVRVRRAIAHSVDKQLLSEGVFDGQATITDTFLSPDMPYFAELDRVITKYPYDPRRSEQLMAEAGFTKDSGGFFASGGERFSPLFWEESGSQNDKELGILVNTWKQAGFDMQSYVLNAVQFNDAQYRASYPTMYTTQGGGATEDRLYIFSSSDVPTAANRWQGTNRGAYTNAEYDRLWDAYGRTLDRGERNQQVVQMMKIASEEVPAIPIYFNFAPMAHLASLKGPALGARIPDPRVFWNIYEWDWAS